MSFLPLSKTPETAELIRVHGIVQGVGFRPMVWKLAKEYGLKGSVSNDGLGVLIKAQGSPAMIGKFVSSLHQQCPPLGRIDQLERKPIKPLAIRKHFTIKPSTASAIKTHIPPDAATCPACLAELNDPANRRYQYPFTNCTHCGPRLSIIRDLPYDRIHTSMAGFALCKPCAGEYQNPTDRRFHAQPNACPDCGPQVWLETSGQANTQGMEAILNTARLLKAGKIVAIKGIGGLHLAVDAGNEAAIQALRERKQRPHKPLALMARDLAQIEAYCRVNLLDATQLLSSAAPIVLLKRKHMDCRLSCLLAPNQRQLGFMLPYSPLHHLLMQQLSHPIVLTSANLSSEPPCTDNQEALIRLAGVADAWLLHDRPIENRIDDSVTRYMGKSHRLLRRARGFAPSPFALGHEFAACPDILAMGSELKNTFCLGKGSQAVLSQHMGDLENFATYTDYQKNLGLYTKLYGHHPKAIVVDRHPEYLSSKLGRTWAQEQQIPLLEVGHHHAHIAACLAEHRQPLDAPPVLGIVLDGLGLGDDGNLWGGEFLLADYHSATRLAHLPAIALPGGGQAMREPWRNTYAHLSHYQLWDKLQASHPDLPLVKRLGQKSLAALEQMIGRGINSPAASSCGRLFDAVAAAIGMGPERISYEGQAAMEMEALLDDAPLDHTGSYPFEWQNQHTAITINARPMWEALLDDLVKQTPAPVIAARFHCGLADCITGLARQLVKTHGIRQIALSGGVFQNKVLFEMVVQGLDTQAEVLTHQQVPPNDGGLALGQWAIAAAHFCKQRQE